LDKVYYEIDPFNRLIARNPPGKASRIKRFRKVIYGRFRTDSDNAIFYEVNKSQGIDIPQKIKFSGRYSLDKSHNFIITLNKWSNQCEGNRLSLKTGIIDAKNNEIAFLINSKAGRNRGLSYVMKLYGAWRADKRNRLIFEVERDGGEADVLALSGAWEIGKNNEIIYRRDKNSQVITFKGRWDIAARGRISYALDKKMNSGFNFKSSLGTLSQNGKNAYLTFDVGINISDAKKLRRKIILTGRWKIDKNKELVFETADAEAGEAKLKFTNKMFSGNGLAYIESMVKGNERFAGGGITFKW